MTEKQRNKKRRRNIEGEEIKRKTNEEKKRDAGKETIREKKKIEREKRTRKNDQSLPL